MSLIIKGLHLIVVR